MTVIVVYRLYCSSTKQWGEKDGKRTGSRGDIIGILAPKFSMLLIRDSVLLVFSVFLRGRNTAQCRFQLQSHEIENYLKGYYF
jgi:hypothetical protein